MNTQTPGKVICSKPLLWLRNDTQNAEAGTQERPFGGGGYSRAASARRSLDKPRAGLLRRISRIRFGCASACRFCADWGLCGRRDRQTRGRPNAPFGSGDIAGSLLFVRPVHFYVCFITLYLSESHASLQGKVIGDMICPSFIPRSLIRLACARQHPVSPYIGTLHNAASLRIIPSAVSLPIASELAAPLSGDALLSSGCRRSSRRYPIPPFPSSLFLANRFGTPAVIFIKIRAKHLKSGRNCDTIRNWLRM